MSRHRVSFFILCTIAMTVVVYCPTPKAKAVSKDAPLTTEELQLFDALARDDTETAHTRLMNLIKAAPVHDATAQIHEAMRYTALLGTAFDLAQRTNREARLAQDMLKLPSSPDREWCLARLALARADEKEVERCEEACGFVPGWMVCGPFDNERGAGFDVAWPPEAQVPDLTQTFAGKSGIPTRWRAVPVRPRLGYVDLNTLCHPNDQTLAYACTLVELAHDATVDVGLASDEGFRIWVDGEELTPRTAEGQITSGHVHRPCTFDQNRWKIALRAGWHWVMLKVTEAEGAWGFRLTMRAEQGVLRMVSPAALEEWNQRLGQLNEQLSERKSSPKVIPARPPQTSETDEHAASQWWRALYEMERQPSEQKQRVAMGLLEKISSGLAQDCAANVRNHVAFVLARACSSTAEVSAGVDENVKRMHLEGILERDPYHVLALMELAEYSSSSLNLPRRAIAYLSLVVARHPGNIRARIRLAQAYARSGLDEEYRRRVAELLVAFPNDAEVCRLAAHAAMGSGETHSARIVLARALELERGNRWSILKAMDDARLRGDTQAFYHLAEQGIWRDPFDLEPRLERARMRTVSEGEAAGLADFETLLELSPDHDGVLSEAGEMALRLADTMERKGGERAELQAQDLRERGKSLLAAALIRNPRRSDLKRRLDFLGEQRPVWEARYQRDISEHIKAALAIEHPPEDPAIFIYADTITQVELDGTSRRFFHLALKVTNDDGRNALQSFAPGGEGECSIVHAGVWRKDQSFEPARINGGQVDNPPLHLGDIFEVRYRMAETEKGFFGDYFGDISILRYTIPATSIRRIYIAPESRELYFHAANGAPAATIEAVSGHRVTIFEVQNTPRFETEGLSPDILEASPCVYVSTFQDWTAFGKWYWNLIQRQMVATPQLKAKVQELVEGIKLADQRAHDEAIVRRIYRFVTTQIRYNDQWEFGVHGYKPYEAGTILDRCIGDCKDKAILMCTMLREAGITAYPVLINLTSLRGNEDLTLAMPHHFNHCIARVEYTDGTGVFLDGTASYNGYDELPAEDSGALVVIITPEGGIPSVIPPYTSDCNEEHLMGTMQIAAQGDVRIEIENRPVGPAAANLRRELEIEERRKHIMQEALAQEIPGVEVLAITTSDLADLDADVRVNTTLSIPAYAEERDGNLRVMPIVRKAQWTRTWVGAPAERSNDLLLPAPFAESLEMLVLAPPGYDIAEVPHDVAAQHEGFSYTLTFTREDGGVRVRRRWAFNASRVMVADYPAFRGKLAIADAGELSTLSFKKQQG